MQLKQRIKFWYNSQIRLRGGRNKWTIKTKNNRNDKAKKNEKEKALDASLKTLPPYNWQLWTKTSTYSINLKRQEQYYYTNFYALKSTSTEVSTVT